MNCVVCNSGAQKFCEVLGHAFHRCCEPSCRHVFVSPVPTEEELVKIYDTDEASIANSDSWVIAQDYERDPAAVHQLYERHRMAFLRRSVPAIADKSCSVLDVGCSTGMFLRTLRDKGYANLHGMDLSEKQAEFTRDTHGIPCATDLAEVPDASFDLITCYAVLEHTRDPLAYCKALVAKLRPGGALAVLVPNYRSLYRMISGSAWLWLIPPVHLQYFGAKSLAKVFENAGLRVRVRETAYSGTYTYILVYHLMRLLKRPMPTTARTGREGTMVMVHVVETLLRLVLLPFRAFAKWTDMGNELVIVGEKPARATSHDTPNAREGARIGSQPVDPKISFSYSQDPPANRWRKPESPS